MSPSLGRVTADEEAVAAAKRVLRKAVLLRRDARDPAQRTADDLARVEVIRRTLADEPPSVVACYLSTGTEPGTLPLVGWLAARDVRVLLPMLTSAGEFRPEPAWADYAGPDALRVGRAGILEPTGAALPGAAVQEAGLVVCPALAASRAGDRLGRGGGWYDRALVAVTAPVWALLNDDELLQLVPTADWDRRVDAVVTPGDLVQCR